MTPDVRRVTPRHIYIPNFDKMLNEEQEFDILNNIRKYYGSVMKKKILLVDDEVDLLQFIKYRLESFGYEIVTLTTGEEALAWLATNIPDLILLDIVLPNIRGEEVCKRLKSNDKLKHIPVILYSAKASEKQWALQQKTLEKKFP